VPASSSDCGRPRAALTTRSRVVRSHLRGRATARSRAQRTAFRGPGRLGAGSGRRDPRGPGRAHSAPLAPQGRRADLHARPRWTRVHALHRPRRVGRSTDARPALRAGTRGGQATPGQLRHAPSGSGREAPCSCGPTEYPHQWSAVLPPPTAQTSPKSSTSSSMRQSGAADRAVAAIGIARPARVCAFTCWRFRRSSAVRSSRGGIRSRVPVRTR
jgi:hypothetical protein